VGAFHERLAQRALCHASSVSRLDCRLELCGLRLCERFVIDVEVGFVIQPNGRLSKVVDSTDSSNSSAVNTLQ
jgi:hypothetical protein